MSLVKWKEARSPPNTARMGDRDSSSSRTWVTTLALPGHDTHRTREQLSSACLSQITSSMVTERLDVMCVPRVTCVSAHEVRQVGPEQDLLSAYGYHSTACLKHLQQKEGRGAGLPFIASAGSTGHQQHLRPGFRKQQL